MPALLRRLSPVGLLATALCAPAATGYLPKVGPPPVRFERPAPAPTESPVVLPPLAIIEPRPPMLHDEPATTAATPAQPTPAEPAPPGDETSVPEPVVVPGLPIMLVDPTATNAIPAGQAVLAPQMFMKYFTGQPGTNGSGISIFAPVEFVPPIPVVPPSSTATFQTTPPAKP